MVAKTQLDWGTHVEGPVWIGDGSGALPGAITYGNPALVVDVKAYGATGDGITDDTAALQAVLAAHSTGKRILWREGTYVITSKLTIPSGSHSFEHVGQGRVVIRQNTSNTPAFFFAEENSYFFGFHGFCFQWGDGLSAVSSSHTQSNGIVFSGASTAGNGFYDFRMSRLRMINGMHLITTDPNKSATTIGFWSGSIRDIFMCSLSVGCAIRMKDMAGGYPAVSVDRLYDIAVNRTERTIDVDGADSWRITNVERNRAGESVSNTPPLARFVDCRNLHLSGVRFENENYRGTTINGAALISLENTDGKVENVAWTAPAGFNLSSGLSVVGTYNNSGLTKRVGLDHVQIRKVNSTAISAFTAGSLYAIRHNTGGGSAQRIFVGSNYMMTDYDGSALLAETTAGIRGTVVYPHALMVRGRSTSVTGAVSFANVSAINGMGITYRVEQPCVAVGLRARSSANLTGSALSVYLKKNGASVGSGAYSSTMAIGASSIEVNADPVYQSGGIGTDHVYAPGDTLSFMLDTNSGTLTSTTDIDCGVILLPI